jgi:hypothetical protein
MAADAHALWVSIRPRDLVRLVVMVEVLRAICAHMGVHVRSPWSAL